MDKNVIGRYFSGLEQDNAKLFDSSQETRNFASLQGFWYATNR